LGHWYDSDPTTRFFYSPRLDTYKYSFAGTGRRRRASQYNNKQCTGAVPTDLQRTTVQRQPNDSLRLENSGDSCSIEENLQGLSPKDLMCQLLPTLTWWVMEHLHLPVDNGLYIVKSIQSHTCIAVSNGSYEPNLCTGAAATTIQGTTADDTIRAECVTPGTKSVQSSYRSELAGLYQTVVIIHVLCKYYGVKEGTDEIACNGLAALNEASKFTQPTALGQGHYNMISAIRRIMRETLIKWKTHHVLGHQVEKGKDRDSLDRWEVLNDEMDALQASSSDILDELRRHINGQLLLAYWKRKGNFDDSTEDTIDWAATKKAMKALPLPRRIHQSKLVSTFVGVRK
jgi:hypothetical protein